MSDDEESYLKELDSCSFCNDTLSLNSGLKILITPCGHTICEPCCGSSFRHKKQLECKGCLTQSTDACVFRKDDLIPTCGEDPYVRKEMKARYKIFAMYPVTRWERRADLLSTRFCSYNKRETDFLKPGTDKSESLRLYNEYLDKVESMVHRLTNNVDVDIIESEMAQYKAENEELIYHNEGLKRNKDSMFGAKLLPWQIAPGKSLHWKEPEDMEVVLPAHVPPQVAQLHIPPKVVQKAAVTHAPVAQELVCSFVKEDKPNRDVDQAKLAGGYSGTFKEARDRSAAVLGIRFALQRWGVRS